MRELGSVNSSSLLGPAESSRPDSSICVAPPEPLLKTIALHAGSSGICLRYPTMTSPLSSHSTSLIRWKLPSHSLLAFMSVRAAVGGWSRGNIVDDRNGDRSEGLALNTHEENRVSRGVYRGDRDRTDVRTNPAGHLDQIGVRRGGGWAKETGQYSVPGAGPRVQSRPLGT